MYKTLPWRTVLESNNAMVKSRPLTQDEWIGRYEEPALRGARASL